MKKTQARPDAAALAVELGEADFGDERLTKRLKKMVGAFALTPDRSFPKLAESEGELEATYRFLSNDRVTLPAILAPHQQATRGRIAECGAVLAIHDTTQFHFGGEDRVGVGSVGVRAVGFQGHFTLAVDAAGDHEPLGVLEVAVLSAPAVKGKFVRPTKGKTALWEEQVLSVERQVRPRSLIHVMDREADSFSLLSKLVTERIRFVIRMQRDRQLIADGDIVAATISATMPLAEDVIERDVPLSRRRHKVPYPNIEKIQPSRPGRRATLRIRARALTVKAPKQDDSDATVRLNVVHVREIDAPADEERVEWYLLTTEPIESKQDIAAVVDHYRGRWVIEEYFKALKTGCAIERRQLESLKALVNALGVFSVIAWQLLRMRNLARASPDRCATGVFTPRQLLILRRRSVRVKLPEEPTVRQALLALAGLGGHLRRNGDPGWQTLAAGMEVLLTLEAGWLAREKM
jgi:hypothetical protein